MTGVTSTPIAAVLFDLDDTLFDQRLWLTRAWACVADVGAEGAVGVDRDRLLAALLAVSAQGSDRGRIIDRALERIGAGRGVSAQPLVDAFREFRADRLVPYPGAKQALARLRKRVPIGVVTDGDPGIQHNKLEALGLDDVFDTVMFSDHLGRAHRKPHPAPFMAALDALWVGPEATVFVGDRPDKDVAGACAVGMRVIRVRTGEYRTAECADRAGAQPWRDVADVVEAIAVIEEQLDGREVLAAAGVDGGAR